MGVKVVCDAEFDSLNPTILWCVVCKEIETGKIKVFRYDEDREFKNFKEYCKKVTHWFGHNFLIFDTPNLNRLVQVSISSSSVIDTLIVSRLLFANRPGGHSIENLGRKHGLRKETIIKYDDPSLIEEYVSRCVSDVEINYKVYKDFEPYLNELSFKQAIETEHQMAIICDEIKTNGFPFNFKMGQNVLEEITHNLNNLTAEIQRSVGPVREDGKTITFRRKKDGEPDKRSLSYIKNDLFHPDTKDGVSKTLITTRPFNPGSPKDRINLLNQSGWNPIIKTDTHRKADQEIRLLKRRGRKIPQEKLDRLEKLKITGWKVCEENLETLPDDAPTGAVKLAQWLTLEGRRSDLEEWLGHVNPSTGRIHGDLYHIGSWTHRTSHSKPNVANIFSTFHGEIKTAIDEIKDKYDGVLRSLWCVEEGQYLVGTDAEGIQLRVLAHLMGDQEYIDAVANGDKKNETDVHNVNKRALGLNSITRDHAKTFIYAWLLGAGTQKVASILMCTTTLASKAVKSFVSRYPGLKRLKEVDIPRDASNGYFVGLDGRKVICSSEHLMLAGYLQNGEKVIMSVANVLWKNKLKEMGVKFQQVNFVHDEWQTIAFSLEDAKTIGEIQCWAISEAGRVLNLSIPLTGESKIGRNWAETH